MSLFGSGTGGSSAAGGTVSSNSLFGSLNLDTTVPAGVSEKRKSISEPSSTTEARPKPNMFNLGSQPAPTGSLFGQPTAATTSAPPSGGLFGSTTATPSAGSSGFGLFNKPATTGTTSSSGGGLFGSVTTSTAPASGSLFGATTTTKPAGTSLFGQPSAATSSAQNTTSSFGTALGQNNLGQSATGSLFGGTSTIQQPNAGQQNDIQAHSRESAYFNGLLERQKKKAKFDNGQSSQLGQLPSMNMDLGDLARRAQELGQKNQKIGQQSSRDSRAHYLLSGSGVTPGQAYKDFQKLDGDGTAVLAAPRIDFAEEGSAYLKGMQARGREAMLRESMDRVYRDVDTFIEQSLGIDFDQQKKRIMQHFGLIAKKDGDPTASTGSFGQSSSPVKGKSTRRSVFGRSGLDKSLIGNASAGVGVSPFGGQNADMPTSLGKNQSIRNLRDKERLFIEKIEAMNMKRKDKEQYKVLREFKEVETSVSSDPPKQLIDAYTALEYITEEERGCKERQFVQAHVLNDNPAGNFRLKRRIIDGSRTFLEKSFFKELEDVLQRNSRAAQIGGKPTIINKIRGYIRVRSEQRDLVPDGAEPAKAGESGDYPWAIVFYLLRSGHVQEAVTYVNEEPSFRSNDRRFISYITAYANSTDRRLGRKVQEMIDGEYQQRVRVAPKGQNDPYQIACYKVVGRCELSQRNLESVGRGVEDWIWLQFSLARETESPEDIAGDIFGLEQICETITEIGQKHFQKGQADTATSYGTYFLMQILAGMFEQAVDYLHSFNSVSAVHVAIALTYYGLLRPSDYQTAPNELLTFSTTQQAQINFVPLIAFYTTTFRAALPVQTVDYLALICLNSDLTPKAIGDIHTNACHECLRELCLETREFAALLGDIRGNGSRISGAIEKRSDIIKLESHEQFLRFITSQAAAVADSRGQTADAVLLYHLCDDYDNVTAVINRSLADAIAIELGDEPMSLQPLKPRNANGSTADTTSLSSQQSNSSLSLTQSTSSPYELAKNMKTLYDSNAMYFSRISNNNRITNRSLLTMLSARQKIEHPTHPEYLAAIEELNDIGILPLDAQGDVSTIRQMATTFSALPQTLARCAGLVILWCVRAIAAERDLIARGGSWSVAADTTEVEKNQLKDQLSQIAKDLMVFAGLVRYKLPGRVYDLLTRAGSDVGGY